MPDRPEGIPDLEFIHGAFWDLCTERPSTFSGVRPIPESKVYWYGHDILGLEGPAYNLFRRLIKALDRAYRKHGEDELKKEERAANRGRKLSNSSNG